MNCAEGRLGYLFLREVKVSWVYLYCMTFVLFI